ncbi:MAG: HD domain-containing protein [Lachnospiraceae bacterium]|nr:HD domain-containing protein [Lachnospiraceae bacterium]
MQQDLDERVWSVFGREEALGNDMLDAIDHGILVGNLAGLLAVELGCDEAFYREIMRAGMLHDIGKLQIGKFLYGRDDAVLQVEEMKYVRMHPKLGYETLQLFGGFSDMLLQAVLHHHENYDGTGYPDNMRGEKIPLAARILRICDVYAALISERPYREAFDSETAVEMMIDEARHFDMRVFLAFLSVVHSEGIKEIWEFVESVNRQIRARGKSKATAEGCIAIDIDQLRGQIDQLRKERRKWEFRAAERYRTAGIEMR